MRRNRKGAIEDDTQTLNLRWRSYQWELKKYGVCLMLILYV